MINQRIKYIKVPPRRAELIIGGDKMYSDDLFNISFEDEVKPKLKGIFREDNKKRLNNLNIVMIEFIKQNKRTDKIIERMDMFLKMQEENNRW